MGGGFLCLYVLIRKQPYRPRFFFKTRMSSPTIVSTNLMPEAIAQRYSGQIASRIEGEYQLLPFVGEDIRVLKKKRGL